MEDFYLSGPDKALAALKSTEHGLSRAEAEKRLAENGKNELERAKSKTLVQRFIEQLVNPMILILLAAAAVSVGITVMEGGAFHEYAEAGIILAVVMLNSVLGVFQESKAEKAIDALREMSAATAKVRRGGVVSHVHSGELVTGDIVLLEAGDAVPADLRLLAAASLSVEEAALTGESVPSEKTHGAITAKKGSIPLGDRKNMAYMGGSVSYGRGEGVVTATGMNTEMGKIANIIQSTEDGQTPLHQYQN